MNYSCAFTPCATAGLIYPSADPFGTVCNPTDANITSTDGAAGLNYSRAVTPGATAGLIYPSAVPFGPCVILPI